MKRLVCMFLISAMSLSLVACGSKSSKAEEDTTSVESIVISSTADKEEEACDPKDFIALWQYKEYPSGYAIYEDGTYELFASNTEGAVYKAEWEMKEENSMILYNTNGFEENTLTLKPDGTMVDDTDDILEKCGPEGFTFTSTPVTGQNSTQTTPSQTDTQYDNNQSYDGSYDYSQGDQGTGDYNNDTPNTGYVDYNNNSGNDNYTIRIYDDSSFELIQNGQVTSGYCNVGEDSVDLYFSDGTPYNSINFTDSGDITDQNGVSYYVP